MDWDNGFNKNKIDINDVAGCYWAINVGDGV